MLDCPHHNLPDWLLLNRFYGDLNYSSDSSDDEDLHYSRIPNNCPEEVFDDSSCVCLNTLFGEINDDDPKMEP